MHLDQLRSGDSARLASVGGPRAFRRRLLELGLLPGTEVRVMRVAPLGDPIELLVRGCSLSIRRAEASNIALHPLAASATRLGGDCCGDGAPDDALPSTEAASQGT